MTSQALSAFVTSGMASFVEFIEAFTVVLAVGATRGWRPAFAGAGSALACLLVLLALFGASLGALPLGSGRLVIGVLLVLFGMRWLRKATRRAAGIIPLRDEAAAYRRHRERVGRIGPVLRWDGPGIAASFQATLIEGLEVIFIVVAVGAGNVELLRPATFGALAALAAVMVLGSLLHGPVTRIPENTLKRLVGATLLSLGTFWTGEGAGLAWPAEDFAILVLGLCYFMLSVAVAGWLRRGRTVPA